MTAAGTPRNEQRRSPCPQDHVPAVMPLCHGLCDRPDCRTGGGIGGPLHRRFRDEHRRCRVVQLPAVGRHLHHDLFAGEWRRHAVLGRFGRRWRRARYPDVADEPDGADAYRHHRPRGRCGMGADKHLSGHRHRHQHHRHRQSGGRGNVADDRHRAWHGVVRRGGRDVAGPDRHRFRIRRDRYPCGRHHRRHRGADGRVDYGNDGERHLQDRRHDPDRGHLQRDGHCHRNPAACVEFGRDGQLFKRQRVQHPELQLHGAGGGCGLRSGLCGDGVACPERRHHPRRRAERRGADLAGARGGRIRWARTGTSSSTGSRRR